jgi:hypothetical protein
MVYRYESGRSEMTLSQLAAYAESLGIQVGDIWPSSTPRTRELRPFLDALESLEPEERPSAIDKASRDIAYWNATFNARMARRDDEHVQGNPTVPYNAGSVTKSNGDDAVGFIGPGAASRLANDEPDPRRRKAEGSKKTRRDRK